MRSLADDDSSASAAVAFRSDLPCFLVVQITEYMEVWPSLDDEVVEKFAPGIRGPVPAFSATYEPPPFLPAGFANTGCLQYSFRCHCPAVFFVLIDYEAYLAAPPVDALERLKGSSLEGSACDTGPDGSSAECTEPNVLTRSNTTYLPLAIHHHDQPCHCELTWDLFDTDMPGQPEAHWCTLALHSPTIQSEILRWITISIIVHQMTMSSGILM